MTHTTDGNKVSDFNDSEKVQFSDSELTELKRFAVERTDATAKQNSRPKLAGTEIAALSIFSGVTAILWITVLAQFLTLGKVVNTFIGTCLIALGGLGQIFAATDPLPRKGLQRNWRPAVHTFSGLAIAIGGLFLFTDAINEAWTTNWGTKLK